jgi:DNA-binding Lrp family transcriptional regulator
VHPLLKQAINLVHAAVGGQVERLREEGFESEYTAKLDRALNRFTDRFIALPVDVVKAHPGRSVKELEQETSIIPEMREDFEKLRDIVIAISEMEKYHFPRWLRWLAEDLKAEGCI